MSGQRRSLFKHGGVAFLQDQLQKKLGDRKFYELKSEKRLKYIRRMRAKGTAGDKFEKVILSKLDRIHITDENVDKILDKFHQKIVLRLRLKEKTIEKVERRLKDVSQAGKQVEKTFSYDFKTPNWGKPDFTDPSVCLDRFFNDMHEVVLDFVAAQIPFKEEGPYAFIKVKIAVKQVNRLMKAFKNSVHFDVHSITAGILNRGGKQCLKPVTFEGFSGGSGYR